MATAKPYLLRRDGPPRRRWRQVLLVLVLLAAGLIVLFWSRLEARGVVAASYGARIACTCHYIEGRGLADCRKDFEPGMDLVMLSDNTASRSITARMPLLATQTASFREGQGCLLQSWTP